MKYTTYQDIKIQPAIGVKRYIVENTIGDHVCKTIHQKSIPQTNRGHEKSNGWLGSWTSGGVQTDTIARGLCQIISTTPVHHYPNPVDYDDPGVPEICGWEIEWETINA